MEAAVLQILIVSSLMVLSQQTALQHVRFMCQQTSLASPAEVLKLRNGDLTNADPKIQKYAYCVYKNLGLTSPDGINKQMGLKMLSPKTDPAKFMSSVDKCNNYHNEGTVEESFWKVLNCFDNKYPGDIYVL